MATVMMVELFVNGKFSVKQLFEHVLPVREIKQAYNNYGDTLISEGVCVLLYELGYGVITYNGGPCIGPFIGASRYLSNFYDVTVTFDNITYDNSEAAFHAQKVLDEELRKQFAKLSPRAAKRKGRRVQLRDDWEDVKDDIMYQIVKAKFEQHPELRDKLRATDNLKIVEFNTWGDREWGVCDGDGLNKLGKILMRVRDELR